MFPSLDLRVFAASRESASCHQEHAEAGLAAYLEDLDDRALAEEAMRDYDPSENISHEEMKRRLGLDNRVRRARAKALGKPDSQISARILAMLDDVSMLDDHVRADTR